MAPVLFDVNYGDGSTGLTLMGIMKYFGRLVCLVLYVVAILICSLARMGHLWNVFEVCTRQIYRDTRIASSILYNIAPLIPAACQAVAPRELRYVESPYLALRKSDPLERLLHFFRPLSGFSRLAFRLFWSQVDFLTQYRKSTRLYQPTPSCRTQESRLPQEEHTRSPS